MKHHSETRRLAAPSIWQSLAMFSILWVAPRAHAQIEEMKASVIYIRCTIPVPDDARSTITSSGTGFAAGDSRHVVTNYHVIAFQAARGSQCSVVQKNGRDIPFRVLPSPSARKKDLAILELDRPSDLIPVTFASQRFPVKQGQSLWAVGFPGETPASSPEARPETLGNLNRGDRYELSGVLNHGNSGGPIFNLCGEVVGIAVAKEALPTEELEERKDLESVIAILKRLAAAEMPEATGYAIRVSELLPELDAANIPYRVALLPCLGASLTTYAVMGAVLLALFATIIAASARGRERVRRSIHVLRRPRPLGAGSRTRLLGVNGHFAGAAVKLSDKSLTIGRDPNSCQLVFPPETKGISRIHCKLSFKNGTAVGQGKWWLEDCGSTDGTFLESGEQLKPGRLYSLKANDRFYLSDQDAMFQVKEQER